MIITTKIKVTPKSKKPGVEVVSVLDNVLTLKVKVSSPPEDGKANKEVIERLSDYFDVPKSKITIKSGHTSREKVFLIDGVEIDKIPRQLTLC